jgi:hypothetical protein
MQIISWSTMVVLALLGTSVPAAPAPAPPEIQVLERTALPGGLVREKLRLPGFDPDEAVPTIAIHRASGGPFPAAIAELTFDSFPNWCILRCGA